MADKPKYSVLQNLQDAGCDSQLIDDFLRFSQKGKVATQLKILAEQRNRLLACIHENQKKLDCLDYLIFTMKKIKVKREE